MFKNLIVGLFCFLLVSSVAHATVVDFTGSYEMQNWTASGTGSEGISPISGPTDTAIFTYDYNKNGYSGSWTFLATAEETGAVNFDWNWTGLHSWYQADGDLYFRTGSSNIHLQDVGGHYFDASNSFSGIVNAGEQFGFYITGSNYDYSQIIRGTLEITNFSAPGAPVPEPSTMILLGCGLMGLVGLGRKKLQQ